MIKKIKTKYVISLAAMLLVIGGSFLIGHSVDATIGAAVAGVLGKLIEVIIWILGKILVLLIYILIKVAQYNDFINSEAVKNGWTIVRDMCNMFFILILLIIAFATILRMESYNWKKMLPKLLIMAVLINFSKTICGVFIDFAQVIMLTFVNGFKDMGGANFTEMLGLKYILSIDTLSSEKVTFLSVSGTYVLALIYVLISVIVIGVLLAVLIMRMVMLWIYIVLSPLAYLLSAFPQGQKYASQWWGEFSKNVIVGPVLAFFIWLSLVSLGTYDATKTDMLGGIDAKNAAVTEKTLTKDEEEAMLNAGLSKAGSPDNMIKFIISIGMLIGGLMVTQQIGGAAGSAAGRGMAAIQKGKGFATSLPGRGTRGAAGMGLTWLSQGDNTTRTGRLREGARNILGNIGGRNIPVVNTLATNTLTGLGAMQRSQEEAAQKYVSNIKDTRILRRIANKGALGTLTPWQNAIRDAARDKAPSLVEDGVQGNYNTMSRKQSQALSRNEWRRLGVLHGAGTLNLNANPDAIHVIQQDAVLRGAVNSGIGVDTYFGSQRDGTAFTGPNGTGGTPGPQMAAPRNPLAYRMAETGENSRGNLSVNRFGKGKDNTVAVDLNELGLDFLKDKNGDIKGFNAVDRDHISKIAEKMVGVIDKELAKLESGHRTTGDEKRMANMRAARERFMDPNKIDNLSLINSGANGYGLNDAKETKIHEEVHGFGVRGEEPTEMITGKVMSAKQYSKRKEMALDEIIKAEEKEEEVVNNFGSRQDDNSPEVKTIVEHIHSGSIDSPKAMKDLVFYMKQLNKTMNNNTGALGKFKNILNNADSNKMSPLEVKVIADKIKKSVK